MSMRFVNSITRLMPWSMPICEALPAVGQRARLTGPVCSIASTAAWRTAPERGAMRVYIEVAKRAFQQQLAYRTANLAGLATNAFWGALRSFLFVGLFQGREAAAGWSVHDAIDYVWITQALIMPVYFWNWSEIAVTIRTGDVVSDLAKPVDYYAFWLSWDAGRAIYHTLFRWLPTTLLGEVLFGVRLPADAARWGWFFLSVALAVWRSFGLRFLSTGS